MRHAVLAVLAAAWLSGPVGAETYSQQAVRLYREGNYNEAEKAARRVMAESLDQHGLDSPEMATALNNLAEINVALGRLLAAESLHRQALAIREEVLGRDHAVTASSLSNLAALCATQRNWAEAGMLYKQALAIREKALGPDHPDTIRSRENLSFVLTSQERYTESARLDIAAPEEAGGERRPSNREGKQNRKGSTALGTKPNPQADTPAVMERNGLAAGMILALVAVALLAALMVGLSNSHLGEKRQAGQGDMRSSPTVAAVATSPEAPVGNVDIAQAAANVATKWSPTGAVVPEPLPVVTHKSNVITSAPEHRTASRRFDSRKKEDSATGLGVFFVLLCCVLAIGGCFYVVASRHPYDPDWRNNPKYDNYDYPLSPDNGGYIGVP